MTEPAGEAGRMAEPGTAGALTTIGPVLAARDAAELDGRRVELTEPVRVLSVTGDRVFWVGEGAGNQTMVVLDQQRTPGMTEGRYDVNPGQMVRIFGYIRSTQPFEQASREWNISQDLRSEYERHPVYIHADRLEITSRP